MSRGGTLLLGLGGSFFDFFFSPPSLPFLRSVVLLSFVPAAAGVVLDFAAGADALKTSFRELFVVAGDFDDAMLGQGRRRMSVKSFQVKGSMRCGRWDSERKETFLFVFGDAKEGRRKDSE